MPKDPARVAAGKRAWAKKSPAQKAAVVSRLRRVRPNKGGGGKSKAKPKGGALTKGGSNPSPAATTNNNKRPKAGATYQAVKVTGEAAVPLTDYALTDGPKTADGLMGHLKDRADLDLAKGYGVAALDFAASKHRFVRHANALSRLSATALAPEGYNILKVVEDVRAKLPARTVHAKMSRRLMGYSPTGGKGSRFTPQDEEFRTYHKIKWLSALARLLANRTRIGRAITRPIRENVLKELGGSV